MQAVFKHNKPAITMLAVLMMLTLLAVQGLGLQHRISHIQQPGWGNTSTTPEESVADTNPEGISHSCLIFDAATLGAMLQSADYIPRLFSHAYKPQLTFPFVSWQAALMKRFSSRAPPLA